MVRNHREDLAIEIDGGVRDDLIGPLLKAGVDRIAVGSILFQSPNPLEKLKKLNFIVNV